MTDINNVTLVGHLTRDLNTNNQAEFAYSPNGNARANISIAVNRSVKRGENWVEDVSYFDVTIWGKTAENLKQYLTKGRMIAVSGYLKQDRWQDKNDGTNRSKISIVAESVQLCGGNQQQNNGYSNPANNPNYVQTQAPSWNNRASSQNQMQNGQNYQQQMGMGYSDNGTFPEDILF